MDKILRIALIESGLNLERGGGSHQSLHLVASGLSELGHNVTLITLDPTLNAFPANLPYRVVVEGPISNSMLHRKYGLALNKVLKKYGDQVDIYHLWGPRFMLDGAMYKHLGGRKPVITYLNSYSFCTRTEFMDCITECYNNCGLLSRIHHRPENFVRKMLLLPFRTFEYCLESQMLQKLDAFIACSPAVAEIYARHNFDQEKTFVIPAGIDYAGLHRLKKERKLEDLHQEDENILYVGRLTAHKGIDTLLRAIARLEFPIHLNILGDGPQKRELERLCLELGIADRVSFQGWMPYDTVTQFYLNSHLFIHPARWPEPLCRTILDAMALGVPIIATNCGGSPWALQDTGLLFQPGDYIDLANKITIIHENQKLASDLTRRARIRAKEFDYKKLVPKLLDTYMKVIEAAKPV